MLERLINTLYPPLVPNYMPAVVKDDSNGCRIYFSLTQFNEPEDIEQVHLVLKYANNNQNALNIQKWPNQIGIFPIEVDSDPLKGDYKYYITFNLMGDGNTRDLASPQGGLQIGQYYKAQLRFSAQILNDGPPYTDPGYGWFLSETNFNFFSEWSKPILIKGIPKPGIFILGQPEDKMTTLIYDLAGYTAPEYDSFNIQAKDFELPASQEGTFANMVVNNFNEKNILIRGGNYTTFFTGAYVCDDPKEPLKEFQAFLYEVNAQGERNQIAETGILYPDITYQEGMADLSLEFLNNQNLLKNSFQFNFKVLIKNATEYDMVFKYTTKSGYLGEEHINYIASLQGNQTLGYFLNPITPQLSKEEGVVSFDIVTTEPITGDLVIKRSSHKSGFRSWDTLYEAPVQNQQLSLGDFNFKDYTAESGNLYKYWVSGRLSENSVLVEYDNVYLVGADSQQLKIGYNTNLSSLRYVVKESKVETLGGKYPVIRRNGNVRYKEFTIGGLIVAEEAFSDTSFLSEVNLYDANIPNGEEVNLEILNKFHSVTSNVSLNYIKEKAFRDKAIEFLYDGNIKLFKSGPEGNSLIRLLDISLTPENAIGRLIYNFSATAIEVDDFSPENCAKYGIQVV